MTTEVKITIGVIYFIILYAIAKFFNRNPDKSEPQFLGVTERQWEAILIFYTAMLIALLQNGKE